MTTTTNLFMPLSHLFPTVFCGSQMLIIPVRAEGAILCRIEDSLCLLAEHCVESNNHNASTIIVFSRRARDSTRSISRDLTLSGTLRSILFLTQRRDTLCLLANHQASHPCGTCRSRYRTVIPILLDSYSMCSSLEVGSALKQW